MKDLKVALGFKELFPNLSKVDETLLHQNKLGFKGFNKSFSRMLEILPSQSIGYWFAILTDIKTGIQDFNKRAIVSNEISRFLRILNVNEIFDLQTVRQEPLPTDYFTKSPSIEKTKRVWNVYFIQAEIGGAVKIGIAVNVSERLKTLQVGSPVKLRIVKIIKGVPPTKEKELHKQFVEYRLHGEWFAEEVLNLI